MRRGCFAAVAVSLLASCAAVPPADTIALSTSRAPAANDVGEDAGGQACTLDSQPGAATGRIFCAKWLQASARLAQVSEQASPAVLVTHSRWRDSLDTNMACDTPAPIQVLGQPGMLLRCRRRVNGLPQIALVARINGKLWAARGALTAQGAMERGIGVLAGSLPPQPVPAVSAGLAAQRLVRAQDTPSNELYEQLHRAAGLANRAGDFVPAEAAYRRALIVGRRLKLPDTYLANDVAGVAVQQSAEGRGKEADARLVDAGRMLSKGEGDDALNPEAAVAALAYDTGLVRLNEGRYRDSLAAMMSADQAYADLLGDDARPRQSGRTGIGALSSAANQTALANDEQRSQFLAALVDAKRHEAVALLKLGDKTASAAAFDQAQNLANANMSEGFSRTAVSANMYRTAAFIDEDQGRAREALYTLGESKQNYRISNPDSLSLAETSLYLAAQQAKAGDTASALMECRETARSLRQTELTIDPDLLEPCLDLIWQQRAALGTDQAAREMFEVAQLALSVTTSQEIATTSVRLKQDPKVGAFIAAREAAKRRENEAEAEHDAAAGDPGRVKQAEDALEQAEKNLNAAEEDLHAKLSNYEQLVQGSVTAAQVFAVLKPHEAFAAILLARPRGWTFLLRDGAIDAKPIEGGTPLIDGLVKRVRASVDGPKSLESDHPEPPPYDTAAAFQLYQSLFGDLSDRLQAASSLTVAPSGSLLSVPFAILLTQSASPDQLHEAAWLVRRLAIAHVPSPASFVLLRKLAGKSAAAHPYLGLGDFEPVSQAQADASFPPARCGNAALRLTSLAPLPGASLVLRILSRKMQAGPQDQLLGADFTVNAVQRANLADYRLLLFETHASLPTDLACENEPALVTSAPAGAPDAWGALLTASKIAELQLNADLVVLAACNTGGPGATTQGESLGGLARSFFAAGARALIVTHWTAFDNTTAKLVVDTITNAQASEFSDMATALAAAQRDMIASSTGDKAFRVHPFFWGHLAIVGAGSAAGAKVAGL